MSDARAEILGRVRARLAADPERGTSTFPLPPVLAATPVALAERYERFRTTLERVGGRVERVASLGAALERVQALVQGRGLRRIALSDAPVLTPLAARWNALELCGPAAPRAALLAAELGVTCAQWGIAETGTLVLESAEERHRLISLVPPVHVALLPAARLLGTLGEALAAVRGSTGAPSSRTITFVTGPSRTADIELTLVVGVHGPRELHVFVHD
ncbi:MAG: lactate utilization protein [Planctomycetes bacterium]|nr:lactate utilization protein [Planctomycetota bacterium]